MPDEVIRAKPKRKVNYLLIITFLIALIALFRPFGQQVKGPSVSQESSMDKINRTKVIRIGYEGYPPYTIEDPKTGQLSGYSVDMADYIAKEAKWKIEWVQSSADTKIPDLQAGRFDVMIEPIFRTIPRATQVTFTRPYAYFGYAAGIVRKGDKRFKKIDDVNKPNVTVAVRLGYTDQTYAELSLPLAKEKAINAAKCAAERTIKKDATSLGSTVF